MNLPVIRSGITDANGAFRENLNPIFNQGSDGFVQMARVRMHARQVVRDDPSLYYRVPYSVFKQVLQYIDACHIVQSRNEIQR